MRRPRQGGADRDTDETVPVNCSFMPQGFSPRRSIASRTAFVLAIICFLSFARNDGNHIGL